ncbi:uncharacterized protein LOC17880977 [Capsella rubella]|uniref:uncharacterized protein LOC17880977 n=1 Tax=Capsella rubella TaxID=81985 RepID=UPI000CD5583F|nr:uncharacterized protein LOC17880977 [Capsella rubella]
MDSSSKESAVNVVSLLGKRNPEDDDDLETKPFLKKHKDTTSSEEKDTAKGFGDTLQLKADKDAAAPAITKKTLYMGHLSGHTKISDIIDFFKDVVQVVRVRLFVSSTHSFMCYGLVEFSSVNEANKARDEKNGEYFLAKRIYLGVPKLHPSPPRPKYCLEHKVCYKDYLRRESLPIEADDAVTRLDEIPDFVEEVLFVANISPQSKILHIKDFFKDVGEVVRVRLIVNHKGKHVGYAFVDFASASEAKKALEKKNGEYLHDHKIILEVAKTAPDPPRPKYNLLEKLCYEDYLLRQNLMTEEDGAAVEGLDETEAVALRKRTLFVSHFSRKAEISHIINFFKDVGQVVSLRLIVDYTGKHVGDGFVEFASASEAETALEKKNGEYLHDHKIFLDVATKAPYPLRPKYCIDHKVWYEDYLGRAGLLIEEDHEAETVEGLDDTPLDFVEAVSVRKTKTLFVAHLTPQTIISDIINFFKDVGQVVHIRLIVNNKGKHVGWGFVEFASAKDAEKALEKKNGERLQGGKIFLEAAKIAPSPPPKRLTPLILFIRFEDHLRQESLLIEEDGAMDGFVETPHFVEEARKKTLFVTNLPPETKIKYITSFFKDVGKIVRVRLIADHTGKQVGCGFVEFASANEAEKVQPCREALGIFQVRRQPPTRTEYEGQIQRILR